MATKAPRLAIGGGRRSRRTTMNSSSTASSSSNSAIDLFLNMDLVQEQDQQQHQDQPAASSSLRATPIAQQLEVVGQDDTLDTNGMSFAEMFRHYLAPEVAKLPGSLTSLSPLPSPLPPTPCSAFNGTEFPLGYNQIDALAAYASPSAFSPFLPAIEGSPIEGFSPSSNNSGSNGFDFGFDGDLSMDVDENGASNAAAASQGSTIEGRNQSDACGAAEEGQWAIDPRLVRLDQATMEQGAMSSTPSLYTSPSPSYSKLTLHSDSLRQASGSIAEEDEEEDDEEETERAIKDEEMDSDEDDGIDTPLQAVTTRSSTSTSSRKVKSSQSLSPTPPIAFTKKKAASQKLAKTSVLPYATAELHVTSSRSTLAPVPDWTDKPDPDAYKALGSKEKRQLRNKISARNFRHRRKEYITTLEEEIAGRDTIIDELRLEVNVLRGDNRQLKDEVGALKQQWTEMMAKMSVLSVDSLPVAPTASPATTGRRSTTVLLSPPTTSAVAAGKRSSKASNLFLSSLPPLPKLPSAQTPISVPLAGTEDCWPLSTSPPAASGSGLSKARGSLSIQKPNLSKDVLPGSMNKGSSGTWNSNGGAYMPIHIMMLPTFNGLNQKGFPNTALSSSPSSPTSTPLASHLGAEYPFRSSLSLSSPLLLDHSQILSGKANSVDHVDHVDLPLYRFSTSDLLAFQSPRVSAEERKRDEFWDGVAKEIMLAAAAVWVEQMMLLAMSSAGRAADMRDRAAGGSGLGESC